MICLFRDYRAVAVITAQTSAPAPADTDAASNADPAPERAALAGAIDAQAHRMDQLSAAIVRATAQVTWSGRAAEQFRARAAERARECLQLAVALRASAERVHAAETARPATHAGQPTAGHVVPGQDSGGDESSGHGAAAGVLGGMAGRGGGTAGRQAGGDYAGAGAGVAAGVPGGLAGRGGSDHAAAQPGAAVPEPAR